MAIWYKVEKTEQGIKDFLDCNWGFHDFRIERVEYVAGNDMIEIFLRYDTGKEGVRLRFTGLSGVHIYVNLDYEADWLYDTTLLLRDDGVSNGLRRRTLARQRRKTPHFALGLNPGK